LLVSDQHLEAGSDTLGSTVGEEDVVPVTIDGGSISLVNVVGDSLSNLGVSLRVGSVSTDWGAEQGVHVVDSCLGIIVDLGGFHDLWVNQSRKNLSVV